MVVACIDVTQADLTIIARPASSKAVVFPSNYYYKYESYCSLWQAALNTHALL